MSGIIEHELEKAETLLGAKFLHAYLECNDALQQGAREMLAIITDPSADPDDRDMALHTLADVLFPVPHNEKLGLDLTESEQMEAQYLPETRQVVEEMDREEAVFAERLGVLMKQRGLSQVQLANLVGVSQPAISVMLNRRCRPQRATVNRFAEALGVPPEELWPAG